jgi:hypothetical protein
MARKQQQINCVLCAVHADILNAGLLYIESQSIQLSQLSSLLGERASDLENYRSSAIVNGCSEKLVAEAWNSSLTQRKEKVCR